MRRWPAAVDGAGPPERLLRYRAEDYQAELVPWTSEGLSRWLQDRAVWRARSGVPLPRMWSLERWAVARYPDLPAHLVQAERQLRLGGPFLGFKR